MFSIRIFGRRLSATRKYHGFKRPVVPSDFEHDKIKSVTKEEFEKKGDKAGRNLYYPKYGASIYDAQKIYKSVNDLNEVKITNTTNYKIDDCRYDYDDEYDATGNGRYD